MCPTTDVIVIKHDGMRLHHKGIKTPVQAMILGRRLTLIELVMPKYFLDCGAHNGCSIRYFRASVPDASTYGIHSFEPNPIFRDQLRRIEGVVFHPEAVWIERQRDPVLCEPSTAARWQHLDCLQDNWRYEHSRNVSTHGPLHELRKLGAVQFSSSGPSLSAEV